MQRFDNEKGKGRNVDILNMREEEADIFYSQFEGLPAELQRSCADELKDQIRKSNQNTSDWILVVHSKEGGVIGRIEVTSFDDKEAAVRIHVPKKDIALKYGMEVVEYFLQICKDNHYFETIELETTPVAAMYRRSRMNNARRVKLNVA